MRFAAKAVPVSAPCPRTASMAYTEQVGLNRQPLPAPNNRDCAGEITAR